MHGGDIYHNCIELDYSVNINPFGVPESVRKALLDGMDDLMKYPDPDYDRLRGALAAVHNTGKEQIVCGNGASELLPAIFRAVKGRTPEKAGRKILLPAPGFTGYLYAARSAGLDVIYYRLREADDYELTESMAEEIAARIGEEKPALVLVTNPNNPNGKLARSESMERIRIACEKEGCVLLVDECFLPFTDGDSMVDNVEMNREIIVLRAFTKTMAIPGVRIGYCICSDEEAAARIKMQLPEWNVSVFAERAALAAIDEGEWLRMCASSIAREREQLAEELKMLGFYVYPSDSNFLLFRDERGIDVKKELLKNRILIRDCSDYEGLGSGYYRVAVKLPEENEKLMKAMKEAVKQDG